ncbi:DUF4129 domain-containing protein [Egicoccus sp. AB-alg6-2]|uniref:DUF4129 domain-containing protein n=1 Tax=Egicoccus sp. AB-alg6-2 TaxID=3242692 RepID=UPI00359DED59
MARDLLARPPYTDAAPGPVTDVLMRVRRWLAALLDTLLGAITGNTAFAWGLVLVATLVLLALVLRWGRQLSAGTAGARGPALPQSRTAEDWRREVDAHVRAQRWPPAVRAAYGALVAELVADGHLEHAEGRTVGEIDDHVRGVLPGRAASIATAGRVFEDVWYGHRQAVREDVDRVLAACRLQPARS